MATSRTRPDAKSRKCLADLRRTAHRADVASSFASAHSYSLSLLSAPREPPLFSPLTLTEARADEQELHAANVYFGRFTDAQLQDTLGLNHKERELTGRGQQLAAFAHKLCGVLEAVEAMKNVASQVEGRSVRWKDMHVLEEVDTVLEGLLADPRVSLWISRGGLDEHTRDVLASRGGLRKAVKWAMTMRVWSFGMWCLVVVGFLVAVLAVKTGLVYGGHTTPLNLHQTPAHSAVETNTATDASLPHPVINMSAWQSYLSTAPPQCHDLFTGISTLQSALANLTSVKDSNNNNNNSANYPLACRALSHLGRKSILLQQKMDGMPTLAGTELKLQDVVEVFEVVDEVRGSGRVVGRWCEVKEVEMTGLREGLGRVEALATGVSARVVGCLRGFRVRNLLVSMEV